MQPHEKSVKLFADCLFISTGSRKYLFFQISANNSRSRSVNLRVLILGRNLRDFVDMRIRALAQLFFNQYFTFLFIHISIIFNLMRKVIIFICN
jgi:hypothetical protein